MSKPRENTNNQRYCVDCNTEVSRYADRCVECRGKHNGFKERKSSINPMYLNPRGSKMRKELGLKEIEYGSRLCSISVEA